MGMPSLPSPPAKDTLTILEEDRSRAVPASTACGCQRVGKKVD